MAHLQDFRRKLQSDGHNAYEMYDNHPTIEHFACWAHARRKFHQALDSDKDRADKIMHLIRILYDTEQESRQKELNYQQRQELRIQKSQPILDQIKQSLDEFSLQRIHPDSRMGKAIAYTLKRWGNLIRYIQHTEVEIDNNLTENSIRPIALGRKNYLFAGSPDAAQNAAMMYSFFGTCKLHNIDPYDWLKDILDQIASHPINQISDLLPQNWAITKITNNN